MRARVLLLPAIAVVATVSLLLLVKPERPGESPDADRGPGTVAPSTKTPRHEPATEAIPAAGSVIFGRVTLDGAPMAAAIEILPSSWGRDETAVREPVATSRSGPDGTFEVSVPPAGQIQVVAAVGDGRCGCRWTEVPVAGLRVEVEVEIRPDDAVLRGRARWRDGRPFTGFLLAQDRVLDLGDSDGRFRFRGLPEGEVTIEARIPGRLDVSSRPIELPRDEPFEFVVDEGLSTLTGRVVTLPDGAPVVGARLATTARAHGSFHHARATTDVDGRFNLDVHDVEVSLELEADGFQPIARAIPAGTGSIDFRLVRGGRLTGVVVDGAAGTPDPGTTVVLAYGAWPHDGVERSATSDASGRFSFPDVPCGTVTLRVGDERRVDTGPETLILAPGDRRDVTLRTRPAARIRGRVVDPDGRGVGAALVTAVQRIDGRATPRETATDADGRFVIRGLRPGVVATVTATAPGWATTRVAPRVPFAADTPPVEIRLPPPRWLAVTVRDAATAAPVVDAVAEALVLEPGGRDRGRSVGNGRTDADGYARLGPLPDGPIGVRVRHPEYIATADPVPADAAVTIRLRRGTAITGRVLRPDGSLAQAGHVDSERGPNRHRCEIENGSFRLAGLEPGQRLKVRAWCYVGGRLLSTAVPATAGDEDVTIALEDEPSVDDPGEVWVRLLDPEGSPVLWAEVRNGEGDTWGVSYWPPGEIRVAESEFQLPRIVVFGARADDGTTLGCVACDPIDPQRIPVEVRLAPARSVAGRVETSDGRPAPGVRVTATMASMGDARAVVSRAGTDAEGRFRLDGLGSGEYLVAVEETGAVRSPEPVRATAGATDVRLVLPPSARAVVTVLDADGRTVPGARVRAGWMISGVADERGVAVLRGLEPEKRGVLTVEPPASRPDLAEAKRRDWMPGDVTVRLGRLLAIAGTVRDERGRPVADAEVRARRSEPWTWEDTRTAGDGSFRIPGLPAGAYDLSVKFGGADRVGPEAVEAGTEDVRVTVRRPVPLRVIVVGWPGGEEVVALVAHDEGESTVRATVGANGQAEFPDVNTGSTYAVMVGPVDGRVGYVPGVRGDVGEVTVALRPAASIRGRVVLPEGSDARHPEIVIRVGVPGFGGWVVDEGGTYEVRGLPPGEWELRAVGPGLRGSVRATAGTTVDIVLQRE